MDSMENHWKYCGAEPRPKAESRESDDVTLYRVLASSLKEDETSKAVGRSRQILRSIVLGTDAA
ncbi:hypothetical protein DPV78_001535 [Talaromyces pinophilus]|jgi:hypothetical protein|nr:hypothetical protein DPV78_001535 [Talaromyces pinophilus]